MIVVDTCGSDRWNLGEAHTCLFKYEEIYSGCRLLICQARLFDLDEIPFQTSPNRLLTQERQKLGLTPEDIAKHFGIEPIIVHRWEDGTIIPSPYFIKKLSTFFGKSAEELGFYTYDTESEWRYSNADIGTFADECEAE